MKSGTAFVGGLVQDHSAMHADDLPCKAQTKSESPAGRTTRIKRIEQMLTHFVTDDSWSIVDNGKFAGARQVIAECHRDTSIPIVPCSDSIELWCS